MLADSRTAAVAIVRALLAEDMNALTTALPDGLPEPARELVASLASLTVLSTRVAARAEGITDSEYLNRLAEIWADGRGPAPE
ncbi:MAG: hypothetical protein ACRDOE_04445 [Streptosporangiaceae bacterium]